MLDLVLGDQEVITHSFI